MDKAIFMPRDPKISRAKSKEPHKQAAKAASKSSEQFIIDAASKQKFQKQHHACGPTTATR
jgi:hypothetical protein